MIVALSLLAAFTVAASGKPKAQLRKAEYEVALHCKNCVNKVNENISFEKGVKDLQISLEDQNVVVVYNSDKTDAAKLKSAIEKLGYKVVLKQDKAL